VPGRALVARARARPQATRGRSTVACPTEADLRRRSPGGASPAPAASPQLQPPPNRRFCASPAPPPLPRQGPPPPGSGAVQDPPRRGPPDAVIKEDAARGKVWHGHARRDHEKGGRKGRQAARSIPALPAQAVAGARVAKPPVRVPARKPGKPWPAIASPLAPTCDPPNPRPPHERHPPAPNTQHPTPKPPTTQTPDLHFQGAREELLRREHPRAHHGGALRGRRPAAAQHAAQQPEVGLRHRPGEPAPSSVVAVFGAHAHRFCFAGQPLAHAGATAPGVPTRPTPSPHRRRPFQPQRLKDYINDSPGVGSYYA
jgi:hypothetical protein